MKRFILFISLLFPNFQAFAAGPSTTCPSGYVKISEDYMTIAGSSCPSGYYSAGSASSCLNSSDGSCMMFVPAGMRFQDSSGEYEYTDVCPLE